MRVSESLKEGATKINKAGATTEAACSEQVFSVVGFPSTGADIRSVCTEAGMFAIRARRKVSPSPPALQLQYTFSPFTAGCNRERFH